MQSGNSIADANNSYVQHTQHEYYRSQSKTAFIDGKCIKYLPRGIPGNFNPKIKEALLLIGKDKFDEARDIMVSNKFSPYNINVI